MGLSGFFSLVFRITLVCFLLGTSFSAFASIDFSKFSETHDIYKNIEGSIFIIGKPDHVDIPYNVDIPFPSAFSSFEIKPVFDYDGNPTGLYKVVSLGEGYIPDRDVLSPLSDELDYKIDDFDADTELEISIQLTDEKIGYFGLDVNEEGQVALKLEKDELVRSIGPSLIYENISSSPDRTNNLPGGLKGNFSVTVGGEGTYTVPLAMPPGVNGFAPQLSVNYSSGAQNGLLGLGWQLAGFDLIRRCSGNHGLDADSDGNADGQFGVTFTETDRLCWGGDQLVLLGSEHDYWDVGAKFRLQDDQSIQFERQQNGAMQYTDQGGMTTVLKSVDPMHWGVDTITDLLGNVIKVTYEEDKGVGLVPIVDTVKYGAYKIVFKFPWGRNDPQIAAWLNQPRIMSRYLSNINYYHVDENTKTETLIKEYRFHYQDLAKEAKGPLLLRNIQDCRYDESGQNSRCLKPLDITYSDNDFEFTREWSLQQELGTDAQYIKNISSTDWNFDGKDDLMIFIDKEGIGELKAYLTGENKLLDIVNSDKNAIYSTLDFFILPDGTKGAVYQTETSFTSQVETISYGGPNSRFVIPAKLVATGQACTKTSIKKTPQFKRITYSNGTTREVEMKPLITTQTTQIPYQGNRSSSSTKIAIYAVDPENPQNDIFIGYRKTGGMRCFNDEHSKGWYIYYSEMVLPKGQIHVGERYTHQLNWNVSLFSGKEDTPAGSAFLPMQYCGLSDEIAKVKQSMSVYPSITDVNGDGALDIIAPVRNNEISSNCSKLYKPENKWDTSYVNLLHPHFIENIKSSRTSSLDLGSVIYTDETRKFKVKDEYALLSLNVPSEKPASLYFSQHGSGANGLLISENGRLVSATPKNSQVGTAIDPKAATWQQTMQYDRALETQTVTIVNSASGDLANSLLLSQYKSEFNEFVDIPGKEWNTASLESGYDSSIAFNGEGGIIGASGAFYSANSSKKIPKDLVLTSLQEDRRYISLFNNIAPEDAANDIPRNSYAETQIKQSVPVFTQGSNYQLTSAEYITGQTVSASLENEMSFGSSNTTEDYESNFMSSFDPYDTVFADFNHDGKTDALWRVNDSWQTEYKIQYGGGTVFQTDAAVEFFHDRVGEGMTISNDFAFGDQVIVFDYDREGCLDILLTYNDGPARIYRCRYDEVNSTWFEAVAELPAGTKGNADSITMLDFDGDGFQDIAVITETGVDIYTQKGIQPVLATKFSNTYANYEDAIEIGYSTLTELAEEETPRYTYSSTFTDSKQEYTSSQIVVESVSYPVTSYSDAVDNVERYSYHGAKFDHKKLRFLGFEKVSKSSALFGRRQDIYYYGSGENGTPPGFPESLLSGRPVRVDTYNTFGAEDVRISSQVYDWALTEHTRSPRAYAKNMFEVSYDKSGNEVSSQLTETILDETEWGRVSQVNTKQGYGAAEPATCIFGDSGNNCTIGTVVKEQSSNLQYKNQSINFLEQATNTIDYLAFNISSSALDAYGLSPQFYSGSSSFSSITKNDEHSAYPNIVGTTTSGLSLDSLSAIKAITHISSRSAGHVIDGSSVMNANESIPLDSNYLTVQEQKSLVSDWESGTFALSTETYLNEQDIFTMDASYDVRFGAPTSIIEPNGETTYIEYDMLGVPVKVSKNSAEIIIQIEECGLVACMVDGQTIAGAVFKATRTINDTSTSESTKVETYADAYGRTLVSKTYLPESKVIVSRTNYDQRGRTSSVLLPCIEGQCTNLVATQYNYFDTEEKSEVTRKDGSIATTTADFSIAGRSTVRSIHQTAHESDIQNLVQGTRTLVKETIYDVLGQLMESTQFDLDGTTALTSVSYQYDVMGRLIHSEVKDLDALESQHTLIVYDDEARSQTLYEPNTGISIEYSDVLGRVRKSVKMGNTSLGHAGQTAIENRMEYDALGRVISSWDSISNQTDRYIYDAYETVAIPSSFLDQGTSCPTTALCEVISGDGKTHNLYSYSAGNDGKGINLSRALLRRKGGAATEFKDFQFGFDYDGLGQLTSQTLPNGKKLNRSYAGGMLSSVALQNLDGAATPIYNMTDLNHFGQFEKLNLGNGATITSTVDSLGRLKGIKAATQPLLSVPESIFFEENYAMDSAATILGRHSTVHGKQSTAEGVLIGEVSQIAEQFIYDGLGRLAQHQYSASFTNPDIEAQTSAKDYTYDRFGNLLQGERQQSYNYSSPQDTLSEHCNTHALNFGTGPHTVRNTAKTLHCYDQFGRVSLSQAYTMTDVDGVPTPTMDSSDQRSIAYNALDKPMIIAMANGNTLNFEYGPDGMRQYSVSTINGVTQEVYYLLGGAYEYVEKSSGEISSRHYIDGVAVYEEQEATSTLKYFVKDYLGTTRLVLSDNLEADFPNVFKSGDNYTPFGIREFNAILGIDNPDSPDRRGFTGHEHFDAFGIIHMNGRIYDPELGRFLSADPLVSNPLNSQSYNRYSYVMNNPMSFTDPSGYWQAMPFTDYGGNTSAEVMGYIIISNIYKDAANYDRSGSIDNYGGDFHGNNDINNLQQSIDRGQIGTPGTNYSDGYQSVGGGGSGVLAGGGGGSSHGRGNRNRKPTPVTVREQETISKNSQSKVIKSSIISVSSSSQIGWNMPERSTVLVDARNEAQSKADSVIDKSSDYVNALRGGRSGGANMQRVARGAQKGYSLTLVAHTDKNNDYFGGHSFAILKDSSGGIQSFGYYAGNTGDYVAASMGTGKGLVRNERVTGYFDKFIHNIGRNAFQTFEINEDQYNSALSLMHAVQANPGNYQAIWNSCSTFVKDVARAAGQDAGGWGQTPYLQYIRFGRIPIGTKPAGWEEYE